MCQSLIKASRAGIMRDDLILHKEAKRSRVARSREPSHLGDGSGEVKCAAGESWELPEPAKAQVTTAVGTATLWFSV